MPELRIPGIDIYWDQTALSLVRQHPSQPTAPPQVTVIPFDQVAHVVFKAATRFSPAWVDFVRYDGTPVKYTHDARRSAWCAVIPKVSIPAVQQCIPEWEAARARVAPRPESLPTITCQDDNRRSVTLAADTVTVVPHSIKDLKLTIPLRDVTVFVADRDTRLLTVAWHTTGPDGRRVDSSIALQKCREPGFEALLAVIDDRIPARLRDVRVFPTSDGSIALHNDRINISGTTWLDNNQSHSVPLHALSEIDYDPDPKSTSVKLRLRWDDGKNRVKVNFAGRGAMDALLTAMAPPPHLDGRKARKWRKKAEAQKLFERTKYDNIGPSDTSPRTRRIGRMGRTATVVPFLSTTSSHDVRRMVGAGPDGRAWLAATAASTDDSSDMVAVTDRAGVVVLKVAEPPTYTPWRARPVEVFSAPTSPAPHPPQTFDKPVSATDLQPSARITTKANPYLVFFLTRFVVRDEHGHTILTITEPLRDAFLRRTVRLLAHLLGLLGSNDFGGVIAFFAYVLFLWPLSLFKRRFRFIIRDASERRVGVAEHNTATLEPFNSQVVWMDVETLRAHPPQQLLGAIYPPIASISL